MPLRCPLALALGALSTTLLAAPAQAGPAETYAGQTVEVTHTIRDHRDRTVLTEQRCLQRKAVRQARRMADEQRLSHQDLGPVLADCGLTQAGENVAYGYATGRSAVREGWMRSEGHRANILHRGYRLTGVGAAQDDDGRWYVAQVLGRAS